MATEISVTVFGSTFADAYFRHQQFSRNKHIGMFLLWILPTHAKKKHTHTHFKAEQQGKKMEKHL